MPTRKRIKLGARPRNKGKYRGQKDKDTVIASGDDIDLNEDNVSSANAIDQLSDDNATTPRTSSNDLIASTSTPSSQMTPSESTTNISTPTVSFAPGDEWMGFYDMPLNVAMSDQAAKRAKNKASKAKQRIVTSCIASITSCGTFDAQCAVLLSLLRSQELARHWRAI